MFKLLVLLPFIASLTGSALSAPVAATTTVNPADDSGAAIASAAVAAAAAAATQTVPVIPAGDGASTANIAAIPLPAIPCSSIPFPREGDPDATLPQCNTVFGAGFGISCTINPNPDEVLQPCSEIVGKNVITTDQVGKVTTDANTIIVSPPEGFF
ncbi:hypothetical protein DFH08DRAFT_970360 [Mycena albidolilacea]|uniref:Uncharacterized protein n=1 Tax=Mycena albidolilacea TaxID=1033008 RepID=A0AAD6ZG38_9AGAR|nr:hypothetical protein DFH08DRAFT_970360 [Mycena albidolilacea]